MSFAWCYWCAGYSIENDPDMLWEDGPEYYAAEMVQNIMLLKKWHVGVIDMRDQIDEKTRDGIIRAFWRRIYPYRNDYEKELPEVIPVEFRASMETAFLLLERKEDR